MAPALAALTEKLIDYAGCFPPASLSCADSVANYAEYARGPHARMLRWLVVKTSDLDQIPAEFDGSLSVLAETDQPRAAAIESKTIFAATKPVYCEVPLADLDRVKAAGAFAKLRTGGVTPEAIPSVDAVAEFIVTCAKRQLPFKATAGLHHPVRAAFPLTYEANAPEAVMHGFLNVFLAACFAWHREFDIVGILAETDPNAFYFDDRAHWRSWSLSERRIREARGAFCHSFGSCSFTEPIDDLISLGLL